MANQEHLAILKNGVKAWNEWRLENPAQTPDLSAINLSGVDLRKANFFEVAFHGADLCKTDLSKADLRLADFNRTLLRRATLHGAYLQGTWLRGADLRGADLRESNLLGADLTSAKLGEANLRGADLRKTNFWGANLSRANLGETNLGETSFQNTNLTRANLGSAHLWKTKFFDADLSFTSLNKADLDAVDFQRTNLKGATFSYSRFIDMDLRGVNNLEQTIHSGPSEVSISTLYKSKGQIPHKFLRDAGVPENMITYMSSLTGKAFEYFSAIISYTDADDEIARRLYADLQVAGLRVWRWREDAKWGVPIEKNIDQAVRIYDKLIIICSETSLTKSQGVIDEIDRAFQKENALMKDGKAPEVLFPITIDDYVFDEWDHYFKPKVKAKTVGDFRGWEDPKKYDAALQRLIAGLRLEERA